MSKLKIAIQKSGRLRDASIQLLKDCGIVIENGLDQLKTEAGNFPMEILYLRNSDIPQYLEDGVADVAILGANTLIEKKKRTTIIAPLHFSKCRVSLAIPKATKYTGLHFFQGKRIATSYPATLRDFLGEKQIDAEIHEISGSVEIAPHIGLADAILDIVSSGNTLFRNGLKEVETVLHSEAVLVKSERLTWANQSILEQLLFRIQAVLSARNTKYILMNVPDEKIGVITQMLPVLKSPTILPLAMKGWSSLHSVIRESQFWEVISKLKDAGAEGILVMPIEKMVI